MTQADLQGKKTNILQAREKKVLQLLKDS